MDRERKINKRKIPATPEAGCCYRVKDVVFTSPDLQPGLYLVGTPIGNLGDISLRALQTLAAADLVACEDTRQSVKLLRHYGIHTPMRPYHDHNGGAERPKLLAAISGGKAVALISDAGSPLISDPGYKLVRAAMSSGHTVTSVPGASSVITAIQLSALPSEEYYFVGFLPPRSAARRRKLKDLSALTVSVVIFETPGRLLACLQDIGDQLGMRDVVILRELTKYHEEVIRGTAHDLISTLSARGPLKGELVIVVGPPHLKETDFEAVEAQLVANMKEMPLAQAVRKVVAETGLPRRQVYQRALALAQPDH